jgi:PAS domain S-box-containing protein
VPEKARQQAPQAWQDLLAQKGTAHGTSKNLTKDGRLITCDWYNTPLVGADGNVIGVASLAQDITERRRMERQIQESLERRGRQVQTSTEVSQEIAAAPDLNELFRRVVTLIKEQFNYYHAQIFRYDPIQDAVVLVSGYGAAGQKMLAAGHRLQMGRGVVGTAAVSGESILATDVIQDADWRPNPHLPDTKGELAVPIKFRDQVLGILDVQSDQVGRLSEDDRLLLEGLCGQIAIAIESKRAEEALAREQYLMNALMNNLPDMIYFKDKQSRFIRISQSQSVRFGFGDPAQAIGKSDFDFFTEEHARPAYEDEQQILQTGQPITKEEKETWPDRADTWVLTTKLPLPDENGNIVGTFGVSKDITERRQAEEALRQSEEKYRTILENIQDGYFEVDLAGNFTFFNDVLCGILGYSKDETMGMNYREYMDAESAKAVYRAFNEVYRTRKPSRDIHYELIRKSKARRSIEISASLITDSTGEPIGFRGTLRDITERKQAEEAINEEQHRSQAILETVTVPMIISRLSDSKVLYANQALAQFRHMDLDELIGSHTTDYFVNPDDRNKFVEVLRRQSYANDFETQLRGSGGVVSWVLLSARIINFQNETCVLSSYVDITDRKRVEAEREQLLTQQQKRTLQLQTAAEVSRAASSILSLDELLPQATELVRARFNLYYVGIFLVDESGQWAVLRAGTGEAGQQMLTAGHKLKVGGSSMISWCIVNRQARIALDVGEEAVRFDNPLLPLTRSEAALPLISRGSVIGAVTIQSDQQAAFTAEDITVLQTMADQISNATENARLFEQARAALKEVDAINRRLTGEAWESYLRHRSSEQVIWVSDNDESAPAPLLKADETLSTGQIVIEPEEDKSQATVTAPIMLRGQTIGALRMQTPNAEWNEDVQTILTSIAGHIAQAAENTRLLEVTQERFARERALAEATDKIRRSTEVERVLETAAAELARYLNANTVAVHMSSNVANDGDEKPRDRIADLNR